MRLAAPELRSFTLWRQAADRLLKLEAALITSKRGPTPGSSFGKELEATVQKARLKTDRLYQLAFADSQRLRNGPGK